MTARKTFDRFHNYKKLSTFTLYAVGRVKLMAIENHSLLCCDGENKLYLKKTYELYKERYLQ